MNPPNAQLGAWSIRCYRLLMGLYPSEFRTELGESVDQAFRDLLRDAFKKRGYMGIALLWFRMVPDFVFSAFEQLTSTSGDYLKWYFRLRWVVACALGFGMGSLIATALVAAGFFEYMGLPRHWGLAGLPLWLSMGFFQSQVLTDRFCQRSRWLALTVLGGVGAMVGAWALTTVIPLTHSIDLSGWEGWTLLPVVAIPALAFGVVMGLCQAFAFRRRDVPILRWILVCSVGAYFSELLSFPVSTALTFGAGGYFVSTFIANATAGALLGMATAGPLKRLLWKPSGEQGLPSESAQLRVSPASASTCRRRRWRWCRGRGWGRGSRQCRGRCRRHFCGSVQREHEHDRGVVHLRIVRPDDIRRAAQPSAEHHILLAVHFVGDGGCHSRSRDFRFVKDLALIRADRAEAAIIDGLEDQVARGCRGPPPMPPPPSTFHFSFCWIGSQACNPLRAPCGGSGPNEGSIVLVGPEGRT